MKTVLRAAGVPCARHRLARSATDARDFADRRRVPAGGQAAGRGRCQEHLPPGRSRRPGRLAGGRAAHPGPPRADRGVPDRRRGLLRQRHDRRPGGLGFGLGLPADPAGGAAAPVDAVGGAAAPRHRRPEYDAIRQVAPDALRALGLRTGLTHMEWFRRPDGSVAVSEVGARPPGAQITSMLCYAHDFDLYRAWARLMIDGTFDPPQRKWAVGHRLPARPGRRPGPGGPRPGRAAGRGHRPGRRLPAAAARPAVLGQLRPATAGSPSGTATPRRSPPRSRPSSPPSASS